MNMSILRVMTVSAMAGAALALLFAPRKGTETREQLRQSLRSAKQASQDTIEASKTKMQDSVDKMKHKTDQAATRTEDAIIEARSQVEDAVAETQPKTTGRRPTSPI